MREYPLLQVFQKALVMSGQLTVVVATQFLLRTD